MSLNPTPSQRPLRSKVLLGFGVVLMMLVILATITVRSTRGFIRTSAWVADAHDAIELEERMMRNAGELETASHVYRETGQELDRKTIDGLADALESAVAELRSTATADAHARVLPPELEPLLLHYVTVHRGVAKTRAAPQEDTQAMLRQLRILFTKAQSDERNVLADRVDLTERISASTIAAVIAGCALTIMALCIACLLILRDLTARQRAEEALAQEHNLLSSIINAVPNHVYVKDAKGRFILDNTAHREYLGLSESHSVEGRTVFDYFSPPIAAKFDEDDKRVIGSGEPSLGQEEASFPTDGDQRETWLETNRIAIRDTDGKIVGMVGISSDISVRKANEEKLRHFAAQLERSNNELQNFASVASHDLQEPLRKIQAFGDRLKAKFAPTLGDQGRDYLERMLNAAQRMQTLIQDLLKLSRVTSRQQPFVPCDLAEIVRQVLSDLEIAIEQNKARVEIGPLPTIDADPLHMRQLFQNLIANALKFHKPNERPAVIISGRVFEMTDPLIPGAKVGDKICQIHVQDNGIGFDEKFAEQIFVVFQRLHTREQYAGTGIGLAVCRKITDRHGGSIVAKSAEGQGATFVITLPLKQPIAPANE